MTTTELKLIAPLEAPLPLPHYDDALTESQWTTFLAIADAVIPSVKGSSVDPLKEMAVEAETYSSSAQTLRKRINSEDAQDIAQKFLLENPSSILNFRLSVRRFLSHSLGADAIKGIRVILSALKSV